MSSQWRKPLPSEEILMDPLDEPDESLIAVLDMHEQCKQEVVMLQNITEAMFPIIEKIQEFRSAFRWLLVKLFTTVIPAAVAPMPEKLAAGPYLYRSITTFGKKEYPGKELAEARQKLWNQVYKIEQLCKKYPDAISIFRSLGIEIFSAEGAPRVNILKLARDNEIEGFI